MQLESQRGQTMPFWTIGVLIVLSTLFFLSNYINAVTWQIRAQNAADSAASTALTTQANLWNEESTILYSIALDEYRIRYLNQALLNTINGIGCNPATGSTCDSNYQTLLAELSAATSAYSSAVQLLRQGNNFTEAGQQADQRKAAGKVGNDCSNASDYTCSFVYTALPTSGGSGGKGNKSVASEAEYVACKQLSYFGSALLNLGSAATYKVIGRGAAAVLPANTEAFVPGAINPATNQPYQPVERWATAQGGPAFDVDFRGLTVNLNWYAAGTIRPYNGNLSQGSISC